jgi:hypothetical protein
VELKRWLMPVISNEEQLEAADASAMKLGSNMGSLVTTPVVLGNGKPGKP